MSFAIVRDEDRLAVMNGIIELTKIEHTSHMSRAMLCSCAGVKDTKLRATLQDLVNADMVRQYRVTQSKRPRYFYTVTAKGLRFINEHADRDTKEV